MNKIAPMLDDMIESYAQAGFGYYPEKARKELRALLACARVLRRGIREAGMADADAAKTLRQAISALARLDKLPGGKS